MENKFEKGLKKINKVLNKVILKLMILITCCSTALYAGSITSGSAEIDSYGRIIGGEEMLLQKDKAIEELVVYEEGLNPYYEGVNSKIIAIANIEMDKIESLIENDFKINITQEQDNKNLPQKVEVNDKIIKVSTHSDDADMLNVLYSVIK